MRKKLLVAASALWLLASLAPAAAAPAVHYSSEMRAFPPPFAEVVQDSSVSLVATSERARITVKTSGLVPGNVYTLWGISFSHPENCITPHACGPDDEEQRPDEVGFAIQQVGGHVTGESGNVNFGGSIAVDNAQGAEYHIVVAEHGPLDPANMPAQIKTDGPGVQIGFLAP
jgi:hypothetical protein